jgi:ATP-binding cassette, subfamily B, bacterial
MLTRLRTWRRTAGTLVAICFRADPWRATAMFTCDILSNVALLVSVYAIRLVVDAIVHSDEGAVARAAMLLAVAAALSSA